MRYTVEQIRAITDMAELVRIAVELGVYATKRNPGAYARRVAVADPHGLRNAVISHIQRTPDAPPEFTPDADVPPVKLDVAPETAAGAALWALIEPSVLKSLSEMQREAVEAAAQAAIEKVLPRTVNVKITLPGDVERRVDRVHKTFAKLLRYTQRTSTGRRPNVMLVGPAGSSKSHAVFQLSQALDLPFYQVSIGPQTSESKLVGFVDAQGRDVTTQVRQCYETGGVLCIDEIDAGNPAVLTCLNSITSNGRASFLGSMVEKHPDCVIVGTSNTFGRGADRVYVGRQQLDGATLDRWVQIVWDYDTELEKALWVKSQPQLRWFERVLAVRTAVQELGLRVIVGPRAVQDGCGLLETGNDWADIEDDVLWNRFSTDDRRKVEEHMRNKRKAA